MNDTRPIERLVGLARRRVVLSSCLGALAQGGVWVGIGIVVVAIAVKVIPGVPAWLAGSGLGLWVALNLVVAALGVWVSLEWRRTKASLAEPVAVASMIDVRLGIHDRLSTAMAVAKRSDPFALAALQEGLRAAGDSRVAERLRRVTPITAPRRWWIGPTAIGLSVLTWVFLPQVDWARPAQAAEDSAAQLDAAREASKARIESVEAKINENPQLAAEVAKLADGKSTLGERTDEKHDTPDEVRRETTREVNELARRLDEILKSEQAQQLDAMKDALSRIEPGEASPLKDLAEALKQGDAAKAREALSQLEKKIAGNEMDQKTREELAKSLGELAKQIEQAAAANDGLKKALESAGLDGELAKNPEAAKRAIEGAKSLNESQKEALRKALAAQKKAGEQLERIAKAAKSMCSQCKNPGQAKDGAAAACKNAGESLSDMEMLSEMMKDAEASRSQCKSASQCASDQIAQGSQMNNKGGRAVGGERTKQETATGTKSRKEKVANQGGDIIARQLVEAPPLQGASRAEVEALSGEIGKGYEDGTEDDPVPANLRDVHKRYFGDLKKKMDEKGAKDRAAPQKP